MFDYVFYFDASCRRFSRWLEAHDVEYVRAAGAQEEKLVRIPEDIEDELLEEIDALYDELLAADEARLAEQDGEGYMHVAGISFSLADGRTVQLPCPILPLQHITQPEPVRKTSLLMTT